MVLGYHFETEIPWSRMILWFMVATREMFSAPSGAKLKTLMVLSGVGSLVFYHTFIGIGRVFTETSVELVLRPTYN